MEIFINYVYTLSGFFVQYMALKVMHILHNTFCECIFTDAIYLYVSGKEKMLCLRFVFL